MKLYRLENDNILFTGDIHGGFMLIPNSVNMYGITDASIVVCGDIGLGFEKEGHYTNVFSKMEKRLAKDNVNLYMFRGNHDSREYFDGEHFKQFAHIHVIPDYSVLQSPSRNILCVGGAISIDRLLRKKKMEENAAKYTRYHGCNFHQVLNKILRCYWEDEGVEYNEAELDAITDSGIAIDTVCTHTAPSFCYPQTKIGVQSWLEFDEDLSADLDGERGACDKLFAYLKEKKHPLSNWYYAHFHAATVEIIDGVKYTLLDMARATCKLI